MKDKLKDGTGAFLSMLGSLKPNFLILAALITLITFGVINWVDFGEDIVISHPETGMAYVNGTATLVLALIMLVVGGFIAVMKDLIAGPPPPPKMTEESALKLIDKVIERPVPAPEPTHRVREEVPDAD